MYRVVSLYGKLAVLEGNFNNIKIGQPVQVKPYDPVSKEQRGWYWGVLLRHLSKVTDIPKEKIHDILRYQLGYTVMATRPDGTEVEVPMSTDDAHMNKKEYSKFIEDIWSMLLTSGFQLDYETWLYPEDLNLDEVVDEHERIIALRKQEADNE